MSSFRLSSRSAASTRIIPTIHRFPTLPTHSTRFIRIEAAVLYRRRDGMSETQGIDPRSADGALSRFYAGVSPVLAILLLVGMGGALYAFYRIFLILF
jgi:hypothetical protein